MRHYERQAAALLFASGLSAGAAVNLLTGLVDLTTAPFLGVAFAALLFLAVAGATAYSGSQLETATLETAERDRAHLTKEEREAIREQVASKFVKRARSAMALSALLLLCGCLAIGLITYKTNRAVNNRGKKIMKSDQAKPKIVIIHGTFGSPNENWFPWLAAELRNRGYSVSVPTLPTPEGQSLDSWSAAFESQVGRLTPNMILVGHSMGPGFILRLLEKANKPVLGVFLVAPFTRLLNNPTFDLPNSSFVSRPFDWIKIRENAGRVHIYASDNDPYVPFECTKEVAQGLKSEIILIPGGAHLNKAAGFQEFPRLLQDIVDFDRGRAED